MRSIPSSSCGDIKDKSSKELLFSLPHKGLRCLENLALIGYQNENSWWKHKISLHIEKQVILYAWWRLLLYSRELLIGIKC